MFMITTVYLGIVYFFIHLNYLIDTVSSRFQKGHGTIYHWGQLIMPGALSYTLSVPPCSERGRINEVCTHLYQSLRYGCERRQWYLDRFNQAWLGLNAK